MHRHNPLGILLAFFGIISPIFRLHQNRPFRSEKPNLCQAASARNGFVIVTNAVFRPNCRVIHNRHDIGRAVNVVNIFSSSANLTGTIRFVNCPKARFAHPQALWNAFIRPTQFCSFEKRFPAYERVAKIIYAVTTLAFAAGVFNAYYNRRTKLPFSRGTPFSSRVTYPPWSRSC